MRISNGARTLDDRLRHVDDRLGRSLAALECHRQRDGLENRTEFERAAGNAVELRRILRFRRPRRVDAGKRCRTQHFARRHIEHDRRRTLRTIAPDRPRQLIFDRMLHAEVDRQPHRRPIRARRAMHGFDADVLIDVALEPGNALVVDIDRADQMSRQRATGIGAAQFRSGTTGRASPRSCTRCAVLGDSPRRIHTKRRDLSERLCSSCDWSRSGKISGKLFDDLVAVEHHARIGEQ